MSMSELANDEILRTDRRSLDLRGLINPVVADIHLNGLTTQDDLRRAVQPLAQASPIQKTPQSGALDGLVKYIPTESITLYVAATAAMSSSSVTTTFPWLTLYSLYWGFVVLTPVLFLLIYMGKRRSQGLPRLPAPMTQWPWWKLFAATFAFMVWALAVPPLVTTDAGKIAAAFGAILVSTMLSVLGGVLEPPEVRPA